MTTSSNNQLWFLDSLVIVRVSASDGQDGISILDHRAPHGSSPPLHVHRTEDEVFHILEGEFRFIMQGQERRARAGDIVLAPKGVPHTYRIESAHGGRWLTITAKGDFERFVRAMGRPAERPELPSLPGPPTPEMIQTLTTTAATYGIDIIGPPL
jgi:quercetin dioxygenase-like cupin family protein